MVDVSEPQHHKYDRLSNTVTENNSKSRVLQMVLSDGTTQLTAMEYRFIRELNLDLTLGSKVGSDLVLSVLS